VTDAVTFSLGNGATITLSANEVALSLNFLDNYTLSGGSLSLGAGGNISVGAGLTDNIASVLTGSNGLTYNGNTTGTLTLSGANTYSGGTTLNSGILNINNASALGAVASNTFTIVGGTIDNTSGSAITTGNYVQAWNGDFAFGGTNALNLGTGAVTLNASRVVTTNGTAPLTIGGNVSGTGFGLTKAGAGILVLNGVVGTGAGTVAVNAGTLTLAGANTYSGTTTLSTGATLDFNNAAAIGTGSFLINGGTLDNTTGAAITNSKNNATTIAGNFTFGGTQSLNLGTGAVTLSVTPTITVNGTGALTLGGIVGGTSGLTVSGTGTLQLSGVDIYTGATTINSGATLKLGAAALATTSGITVNSGATLDINAINGLGQKTLTISGAGVSSHGAYYNSSTTDQTVGVQTLVMAANSTIGGAGRLDNRTNGGTATFNMGGFQLTTAMTAAKYFALVSSTVSNPGSILVSTGGLSLEATTNMAGSSTNTVTVNNGAFLNYFNFTGTDAWTHIMQGGSKLQTNSGTTTSTATGPWTLNGTVTVAPTTGDTLALSGNIGGVGSMTMNGGGTLTLTGAGNAYNGISVSSGTVNFNSAQAAGTGVVTLTGGAIAESVANAFTGTAGLSVGGGTATLGQANNFTGGTTVSGSGTLNASVAGAVPFSLNINGGTVIASATGALSGNVTVNGGVLSATGAGVVNSNTVFLNGGSLIGATAGGNYGAVVGGSGANIINPGGIGTNGTLTFSALTAGAGTVLQFDLTGPWTGTPANTGDLLIVSGSGVLSFNNGATLGFTAGMPTATGEYRLIQYTGAAPTLPASLLPTSPRSGIAYSFDTTSDPGFIDLNVVNSSASVSGSWVPSGAGTFSWANAANWTGGVPGVSGDTATFATTLGTSAQTVTLDGGQHVGTLVFNPTGTTGAYTITAGTGGSLALDNGTVPAQVTNTTGNNAVSAPVLLQSNTSFSVASGTTLTISGIINGPGKLTMATGTGNLALSGSNTFTGGIELDSGTLQITTTNSSAALGNQGVAAVTLNGGALSFTPTTGAITLAAGTTFTFGAGGGTINVSGSGTAGKVSASANPNILNGSGTFTKTGGGDLLISQPSLGFTGAVNINGLIEDQQVAALGFGTSTGFSGGTLTINGGGELVSSGVQIFNPITLAGGTVSANSNNNAIFNSTVTVTGASTLAGRLFQTPTSSQNFAINTLTGSGNLNVIGGSTTTNVPGLITIGNASGYTGTITVGTNGAIGIGNSSGGNFFGSNNAISVSTASSAVGLVADGDGTSTPQTIAFTLPTNAINFAAGNTGGYLIGKIGASTQFNQEANKTLSLATALPYNNTNTLNVTPLNGYGLLLTAQPALAAATTFNVGGVTTTAQASNVVPGLALQNLTGAFGITKSGTGTLLLGLNAADASNTFGSGSVIDITGGRVAVYSDAGLGNSGNTVTLDTNAASGNGLLALGSFSTARGIKINQANVGIEVAGGQTLTLTGALTIGAAADILNKNDDGTLILKNTVSGSWSAAGAVTVSGGVVKPLSSSVLGTGGMTVGNVIGAAVQLDTTTLNGGTATPTTFSNAFNLSNSGIQGKGALENVTGANTVSGTITIANAAVIGNDDTANTFVLSAITNTGGFATTGPGNITINGAISANAVTAAGTGNLTLTASSSGMGTVAVDAGTLTFAGNGVNGAGGLNANYGGTLAFDDTGTNISRNNGHSLATAGGGNFNLLGNSSATTAESILGINFGRGETVVTVTPGTGQQANLTLTSTSGAFTRSAFSTAIFASGGSASLATTPTAGAATINTGVITTAGSFVGGGTAGSTANQAILPWALVNNNGVWSLATSTVIGASGYLRTLNASETTAGFVNSFNYSSGSSLIGTFASGSSTITTTNTTGLFVGEAVSGTGIPAGDFITAINPGVSITLSANSTAAGTNVPLTYSTTGVNISLASGSNGPLPVTTNGQSINSLTLNSGANLTLGSAPQTLTIGSSPLGGPILALDTTSGNTISGGLLTAGTNEFVVHTIPGSTLTISSNIIGGGGGANGGLTKGESGTLILGGTAFYSGQTVINSGTLKLSSGNNTIQYANYMAVGSGATLDLNGNAQLVTDLFTDNATVTGLGTVGSSNATVSGAAATSTLAIKGDASSRAFTGTISGGLSLVHSATAATTWTLTQNETYTGSTLINGGTVTLQNAGAFSGTSSVTINRATLNLDNNGGSMDVANRIPAGVGITLGGGTLNYTGRTQYASAETLGAITTTDGANTIGVTQQTAGVSTAALTLTGSSIGRAAGSTVNFTNSGGTLGTIGTNPEILFSSTPTLVGSLLGGAYTVNGTDFASYNPTYGIGALGTTGFAQYSPLLINNASSSDNVSMATSTGTNLNSETINSLRVTGATTIGFNAGQTLTLASGGLLVNSNLTFGSAVNNGSLTSGGSELFLYVNGGTSTINSAITGSGMALVKSGGGTITSAGTNTYTGGTYVDQGTLTLGATGTLGSGGIFVNGGTLTQAAGGTIPSQAVTIAGAGTLTLAGANSISTLTFNNNGGTAAPNISTTGGVLTVNGSITASSNNVGTTAVVTAGTIDLANQASPTITVNPIQFNGQNIAPLQPTLNIAAAIQDSSNAINVTGGGLLQLSSGGSTFTGGVNLASNTSLSIGTNSTNSTATGAVTAGPLGTGTLTIGAGSTLVATGNNTVNNAVNILGNFTFDSNSNAANNLTIGGGFQVTSLPTGGNVAITVNAPQAIGTLGGIVTGAGSSITKNGAGTLALTNSNSFSGGVTLNNGTLLATGSGSLGTGTVTINGGVLQLHSNVSTVFGNNVLINSSLAGAFIDINNVSANTGNVLSMGSLNYTGATGGAAPSTILNITGGNSYKLQFTGTNLTADTTSATFNVGSGLSLILPGGFSNSNIPVNIGPGNLIFSGNNSFTTNTTITGSQQVAAQANAVSSPYGTGTVILGNGSTLGVDTLANTMSSTGYTQGGVTGRFYGWSGTGPGLAVVGATAAGAAGVTGGMSLGDGNISNHPAGIMNGSGPQTTQDTEIYSGLLNVAAGGTYNFGINADDEVELVIDGTAVHLRDNTNGAGGYNAGFITSGGINLSAGLHQIVVLHQNGTGGSGVSVVYNGPDTQGASQPSPGWQNIGTSSLYYNTGGGTSGAATAANGYFNAAQINNAVQLGAGNTATLDGLGSNYNMTFQSLTLGAGSTLNVNNLEGTGFIGSLGTTAVQGTGVTLNTAGILNLIGGVTDGGAGLTKVGVGTLMLGPSGTTFTGNVAVNQGTLQISDPNATTGSPSTALSGGTTTIGLLNTVASGNSWSNGATTITVASTTGLFPGELVSGAGIPANAYIVSITNGTSYVISAATTAAGTTTLTYNSGATLDLNGIPNVGGNIVINGAGPRGTNALAGPAYGATGSVGAALYNSILSPSIFSGNVQIGSPLNAVNPAIGGYGDINVTGVVSDGGSGQAWSKVGPDTLTLSNTANTFTGTLTVSGGILATGSSGALGSGTANGVTVASGAALDLNGQTLSVTKALTINGSGITGLGMNNTLGSLINSSNASAASWAGGVALGSASSIGNAAFAATNSLPAAVTSSPVAGAGDVTLFGVVSGGNALTKVGSDSLYLTAAETYTGATTISAGQLVLSGNGAIATGGTTLSIASGATLVLDDTGTALSNRLGGHGIFTNGNLTILGSATSAVQELISVASNNLNFQNSGSIITLQPNVAQPLLLNITSNTALARTAGATSLFRGNGLGTQAFASLTAGNAGFADGTAANPGFSGTQTGTSGTNRGVLAWALIDTSNTGTGSSFAAYNTTNGFQALNFATDGVTNLLTANTNVLSTTGVTTTAGVNAINSLTLNGGGAVINAGSTLTLNSGGLLNLSGSAATPNTISGSGVLTTLSNAELIVHSTGTSALNISSQITGTSGGLTKADDGKLILSAQELYTGNTTVNGGTLQFAGGNQTIFITPNNGQSPGNQNTTISGQVLQVNLGGTVDLNGTTQMVANLNSANTLPNTGGTVTNSSATQSNFQTVLNANQTFAGSITGNLNLYRAGGFALTLESASSYTGSTTIQGGNTILQDLGALTGTSGIFLNGGALIWADTGTQALANRLPSAAPITLNTGAFVFNARSGTQGAISLGKIAVNSGSNLIQVNPLNGGATLTIGTGTGTPLTHSVGSTVTFNSSVTVGGIGDNGRVFLNGTQPVSNGIIGGWATVYQVDGLVGQTATTPGFAVNTSNGIIALNPNLTTLATGNVPSGANGRVTGNFTLPAGGVTLNTLTATTAGTLTFSGASDTLTVTTGGLLSNVATTVGASAGQGNLTAGAGQAELFLHSGAGALTINSSITDNGVAGGLNVVADPMAGNGTLVFASPGTYLGTTYLNNIGTTLNATGGPAIPGNLVMTGGVSASDSTNATTTFSQRIRLRPARL